jgi:hypothetical protein
VLVGRAQCSGTKGALFLSTLPAENH